MEKVEQDTKELTDEQINEDLDKEFLKAIFWNPFRSTESSWQYCMFNYATSFPEIGMDYPSTWPS